MTRILLGLALTALILGIPAFICLRGTLRRERAWWAAIDARQAMERFPVGEPTVYRRSPQ